MTELIQKGTAAKNASFKLMNLSQTTKSNVLKAIADALVENTDYLINENAKDIANAKAKGISDAMLDRLSVNAKRIADMADGVRSVEALQDPIGEVTYMTKRPNGLMIGQKRVPLGVIAIIYEARPNVTVDAAALCIKTSNAVILRGGSEAINSNKALMSVMQKAAYAAGLPEGSISLIEDTSRQTATELMRLKDYIDVLIPRGGAGLIKSVVENATVPVIETGTGNCHVYVDGDCDFKMAENIVINAKTSRPSVCNAEETLLVDKSIAKEFLPGMLKKLSDLNVEIRGCEQTLQIYQDAVPATEEDWYKEYNDYIIAVKVVDGIDEAIAHINKYNTKHSEAIVTNNYAKANRFLNEIDAAAVYVNASTRFTDGFEFGFGAEIGISTQKIHARGPMGLKELTTLKYIIYGDGQVR